MNKVQIIASSRLSALKEKLKGSSWFSLFAYFLIFMSGTRLTLAESDTTDFSTLSQAPTGAPIVGIITTWAICNARKHKAIGGWLLYYYMQLFGGIVFFILFTLLSIETIVENLNIANWGNEIMQYFLYVVSIIPTDILLIIVPDF